MESENKPETVENELEKEEKPRILRAAPTRKNRYASHQKRHEKDQKEDEIKGNRESGKK
ncbi:unnamed protein product [Larinioides sclopetarius]|uniref:Uncharacterized protein n=1 Tax=Larinioides sclopetarius TaxID=280406 RepID=A0AAV2BC48_9ARAC